MDQNIPLVNIIIANHNYGKYIEKAINSALQQDYPNIAISIVDDCSTDNSWEVIHNTVFKKHPHEKRNNQYYNLKIANIKRGPVNCKIKAYQLLEQRGPSEARNLAIHDNIDKSDFFAILDADDEYYENKVRTLMNLAMVSQNVGVVYGDYDILNVETGVLTREFKEPFSLERLRKECIVHSGALISKHALESTKEQTGYYDARLRCAEDYDLWLRISEKFIILHSPQSLSLVRTHRQNSTHSVDKQIWESCWRLVSEKFQHRIANGTQL